MKEILESEEIFKAYATIDAGYFMLNQILKELQKVNPNFVEIIDDLTKFDEIELQDMYKSAIAILEDIIEAKKVIEADFSSDAEFLEQLNKNVISA